MKPLYQARYRGRPEWDWEYTTRGYTVTDLEKAKKPTYKWLEEAKRRDRPLQVQVVIVDPEKRWGEVMWEDFYKKDEFYKDKEGERCQIAKDITKDLLEEECQTDDSKCMIAKEILNATVNWECETMGELEKFIEKYIPIERLEFKDDSYYFIAKTIKGSRYIELIKDKIIADYPLDSKHFKGDTMDYEYFWEILKENMIIKIFIKMSHYKGDLPFQEIKIFRVRKKR